MLYEFASETAGPVDALLTEDMTGQGRRARAIGGRRRSVCIDIPNYANPAFA